jgi:hypothetical protein
MRRQRFELLDVAFPKTLLSGSSASMAAVNRAGMPIDTASYVQSPAIFLTSATIRLVMSVGPDENDRRSFWPVATNLDRASAHIDREHGFDRGPHCNAPACAGLS